MNNCSALEVGADRLCTKDRRSSHRTASTRITVGAMKIGDGRCVAKMTVRPAVRSDPPTTETVSQFGEIRMQTYLYP